VKNLITSLLLFTCILVAAQDEVAYNKILQETSDVSLNDSFLIDPGTFTLQLLDTFSMKKWFARILPDHANNRLKNRKYYMAGKITSNKNFDLLFLVEEKETDDSSLSQVVYLVSTKKDGSFVASLPVAATGNHKNSLYTTSSWLWKDNSLLLNQEMSVNDKPYANIRRYKINTGGRFLLSAGN